MMNRAKAMSVSVALSAAPVVRADAVVVPIRSASLGMPMGGMVSDVLVRENDCGRRGATAGSD